MLQWFNSREATQVGTALADQFAPQATRDAQAKNGSQGELAAPLQELLRRAERETQPLKFNFYKRAKFANSFKWRLLENGVNRELADEVTQRLIMHLSLSQTGSMPASDSGVAPNGHVPSTSAKSLLLKGNDYLSKGAYAEAIDAYQELLKINPRHAEGLNNLGAAFCKLGRYDDAQNCFQQAVSLQPNYAEAHNNLGNVLKWRGLMVAAEKFLRRALKLNPSYLDARINLGLVLTFMSRLREAKGQFNRVLKTAPRKPEAICGMGQIAAIEGRFDEAETLFKRTLEVDPGMSSALASLASLRRMTPADAAWLAQVEKVAASGLVPLDEADVRFAMGKYFDDVGDFAHAFQNYQRANELQKTLAVPYDRAAHSVFVDEMIRAYSRESVSTVPAGSSTSIKPVFVVGMPRSGTSLAEQIIASHHSVKGAGELSFWSDAMDAHRAEIAQGLLSEATRKKLAEDCLRVLEARFPDAAHVIDKAPVNSDHIGLIHSVFPNARFMYMRRDPIDTCLSIYFQRFSPALNYAMDLSDLAHYYREHKRLVAHWRAVLPAEVFLDVPYAELVADQAGRTRRILEFLGLDWDERCMEFDKTDRPVVTASYWQVRQKIYKSSVARWRNYEKFIGPLRTLKD